MTEPLVPSDLDLRNMAFMPLDVVRLRDSDIARKESGESFRAAVLLWCAAWHQVPASSLPSDDVSLASYAGFGRDIKGWQKIKMGALHGFIECSDGRLYHSVIADKALEAGRKREAYRKRTKSATDARWKRDGLRNGERNGLRNGERTDCNTDVSVSVRDKEKNSEPNGSDAKASPIYTDSTHELWGEGIPILRNLGVSERDARSNVGRWLRETKNDAQRVLGAIQRARDARAIEPIAWVTRGLQTNGNGQNHAGNRANQTIDEAGAELFAEAAARQCRGASGSGLAAPLRITSDQGRK